MQTRWFSLIQKGFLAVGISSLLAACGGDEVAEPEEQIAIVGGTMAQRLSAEVRRILPKEAGKDWVFDGYSDPQTREVAWSRFWTRHVDFTGVAWDSPRTLTMITPRHVVFAKHYVRKAGDVVKFHDRRGVEVQRVLMGLVKVPGSWDVGVGILNEPVPAGVKIYKLPTPAEDLHTQLNGALAIVTDGKRKVHVHECRAMRPDRVVFRKSASIPDGFFSALVKGDSGNPSFVLSRGEPVLIETHHTGGAGSGPFYGNPQIQAEIRNAIAELAVQFGGGELSFGTVSL